MANIPKYCQIALDECRTISQEAYEKNQVFSAYSSHDNEIVNQIESTLKNLNKETDSKWVSWQNDMEIENTLIFCEICKNICQSKAVLVELSDLNFNVIFEYGFSLGLGKKIHPIVGNDFDFHNIERFIYPLLGIGLGKYEENKLFKKLLKKRFWEKEIQKQVYDFSQDNILDSSFNIQSNSLLYIKNVDSPQVSDAIESELSKFSIDVIVDDAQEEKYNLIWYAKQIKRSYAAIIDLGMSHKKENLKHFLKCAFISGICVATGRRLLILNSIHAPKPSDIIAFIKDYDSPKSASRKAHKFLNEHANAFSQINSYISTLNLGKETIFDKIDLGEHVAINDKFFIEKCFVEIPEYHGLKKNGYKIIIGRKGTGKSASFFHFKCDTNKRNEIIIHQLFDKYNLNDIYSLTEDYDDLNEKNKIATAFWSFVIYFIIAQKIREKIEDTSDLAACIGIDHINDNFSRYYDSLAFSDRNKSNTEYLIEMINDIKKDGASDIKAIQKKFYSDILVQLKQKVFQYLNESECHLCINIDGLDSNIDIQKNKEIISLILFNLHEVCANLFGHNFNNFSINLFLRTDLYIAFKDKITEKDKITKLFFSWKPDYLVQIINNRLNENNIDHISNLLHDTFTMADLIKKVNKFVYDRPRDYVFLFNTMIQIAQSFKMNYIDLKVFSNALDYYALHVNESLEAEFIAFKFNINYKILMTKLKDSLKSEKNRIRSKKFMQLITDIGLDKSDIQPFLSYALQIKLILIYQNDEPIEWNRLSNADIKLEQILEKSHNRYFYFTPIIQKILEDFF